MIFNEWWFNIFHMQQNWLTSFEYNQLFGKFTKDPLQSLYGRWEHLGLVFITALPRASQAAII